MFWLLSATALRPKDVPGLVELRRFLLDCPTWMSAFVTVTVSVIVSASVIYIGFLVWRMFKESTNWV